MALDKNFSRLLQAVLYIDNNSTYGKTEEVQNPEIVAKMVDHKVLGMNGTLELSAGLDKMEGSFKLNGPEEEIAAMAADVYTQHEFIFRGNQEVYRGQTKIADRPYVVIWRGTFKKSKLGDQKQHENMELNYNINVVYVKLTVNGVPKVEIDIINNIHKVNGKDLLATVRQNLGMS